MKVINHNIATIMALMMLMLTKAPGEIGRKAVVGVTIDNRYTLSISSGEGGTVTIPGEGEYPYEEGATASVQAKANTHYSASAQEINIALSHRIFET